VIGVLPREAVLPPSADLWVPLAADPAEKEVLPDRDWAAQARRHFEQARDDLTRIHRGPHPVGRKDNEITSPKLMSLPTVSWAVSARRERAAGSSRHRPVDRLRQHRRSDDGPRGLPHPRIGYPRRMGASRAGIARQLFIESLLYAAIGGLAGILLGRVLLRGLIATMPDRPLPGWTSQWTSGRCCSRSQ
jgi:hypothetical protein